MDHTSPSLFDQSPEPEDRPLHRIGSVEIPAAADPNWEEWMRYLSNTKRSESLKFYGGRRVYSWMTTNREKTHRFELGRSWRMSDAGFLVALMLNPSTATHENLDPTVTRIERRAQQMDFDGFVVLNLFAVRSTDPRGLIDHSDPVGVWNDVAIRRVIESPFCQMALCGWGSHHYLGRLVPDRAAAVLEMLSAQKHKFHALKINEDGQPKHPLYCGYSLLPFHWAGQ